MPSMINGGHGTMGIHPRALQAYMDRRGLMQSDLADLADIDVKTVARLLDGQGGTASIIKKIARVLSVSPESLEVAPKEENPKSAQFRFLMSPDDEANFNFIEKEFGLSRRVLISMAPLLFSIIAEMSLRQRKSDLDSVKTLGAHSMRRFMYTAEVSIKNRDVFGRMLFADPIHGDTPEWMEGESDPLYEYVKHLLKDAGIENCEIESLTMKSAFFRLGTKSAEPSSVNHLDI